MAKSISQIIYVLILIPACCLSSDIFLTIGNDSYPDMLSLKLVDGKM